jgi:hypothetical protein
MSTETDPENTPKDMANKKRFLRRNWKEFLFLLLPLLTAFLYFTGFSREDAITANMQVPGFQADGSIGYRYATGFDSFGRFIAILLQSKYLWWALLLTAGAIIFVRCLDALGQRSESKIAPWREKLLSHWWVRTVGISILLPFAGLMGLFYLLIMIFFAESVGFLTGQDQMKQQNHVFDQTCRIDQTKCDRLHTNYGDIIGKVVSGDAKHLYVRTLDGYAFVPKEALRSISFGQTAIAPQPPVKQP